MGILAAQVSLIILSMTWIVLNLGVRNGKGFTIQHRKW